MLCTVKWVKKSPTVESSTWPLNSHNCSENHTKSKKKILPFEVLRALIEKEVDPQSLVKIPFHAGRQLVPYISALQVDRFWGAEQYSSGSSIQPFAL